MVVVSYAQPTADQDNEHFRVQLEAWGRRFEEDLAYPPGPQDGSIEEILHGQSVSDPWRSLEDQDGDSTKRFVDTQNEVSTARRLRKVG